MERQSGIKNPGTTCWLASCVHVLASIPMFRRGLYTIDCKDFVDKDGKREEKYDERVNFTTQLQLTLYKLLLRETKSISIHELLKAGKHLYPTLFSSNNHEDCSDHFFKILETFEKFSKPLQCFFTTTTETKELRKAYNAVISLRCAPNFYNALQELWYNSNTWLKHLPEVITFTINRSGKNHTKDKTPLIVNEEIYLDRHCFKRKKESVAIFERTDDPSAVFKENIKDWNKEKYTLTAVIMHNGERTDIGHYFVYILDSRSAHDLTYILYDDEFVRTYKIQEVRNKWSGLDNDTSSSACLLIYTKNEVLDSPWYKSSIPEDVLYSDSMKNAIKQMKTREEEQKLERTREATRRAAERQTTAVKESVSKENRPPIKRAISASEIQRTDSSTSPATAENQRELTPAERDENEKCKSYSGKSLKMRRIEKDEDERHQKPRTQKSAKTITMNSLNKSLASMRNESTHHEASTSSGEVSGRDRSKAMDTFLDYLSNDRSPLYPEKLSDEFCEENSMKFRNLISEVFELERISKDEAQNRKAIRLKQREVLRSSMSSLLPEKMLKDLQSSSRNEVRHAIKNVVEWLISHNGDNSIEWWKNALLFSLAMDGDLSCGAAIRAVVESSKMNRNLRETFLIPLMEKRQSALIKSDYVYHRFDLFLLIANEYWDCIFNWEIVYPTRKDFEYHARETQRFTQNLHKSIAWSVRHFITIFEGLRELMKTAEVSRVRECCGINETVLGRISTIAYAMSIIRLLHVSRRKVHNVNVESGEVQIKDQAKVNRLITDLNRIRSNLRAIVKLRSLLSWWESTTGEKKDIELVMLKMEDPLGRAARNLAVTIDPNNVDDLPNQTSQNDDWREGALKKVTSLKDMTFAKTETSVYETMGDFPSLINIIADCERNTYFARGERGRKDEDSDELDPEEEELRYLCSTFGYG